MPVDLDLFLSASQFHCVEALHCDPLSYSGQHVGVGRRSRRVGVVQDVFLANKATEEPDTAKAPDSRKKKVSFADDKGLDLVDIREISESSESTFAVLIDGPKPTSQNKEWRLASDHPPWNPGELCQTLRQKNVVLQAVYVRRGSTDVLKGTVRVQNLGYRKDVFVRISFDRWVTFVDSIAEYIQPELDANKAYEYDSFGFSIEIPRSAMRYGVIEFCVCFKCEGRLFWDNNGGINYRLVSDIIVNNVSPCSFEKENISLSLTENIQNFSEIEAWSNFICNQPYW